MRMWSDFARPYEGAGGRNPDFLVGCWALCAAEAGMRLRCFQRLATGLGVKSRSLLRSLTFGVFTGASLLWAASAAGANAVTPAPPGGAKLAVGFDAMGDLKGALCRKEPCEIGSGQSVGLPEELRASKEKARLSIVPLGKGSYVVHVAVPRTPGRAWEALVGQRGGKVVVVFAGETGPVTGAEGERSGAVVNVSEATSDGSRRVVVGEMLESMSLCGRPAVLSPKLLLPKDMKLHSAKVQRLTPEERASAISLTATVVDPESKPGPSLLRAISASSAVGNPSALTDGDLETTWAEGRGGSGRGEFALMLSPPEVPLSAFEFVIRPPSREVAHGSAPKSFFLALTKQLFKVEMPEDAWQFPGRRYRVELNEAVTSDCVALVTDDAFDESKSSQVSFAELNAVSSFDTQNLEGLVGALAGGGERAEAAGAVLRGLGAPAFAEIRKRFKSLDAGGRRVALDVMDHAPCSDSATVYVEALLSKYEAHRIHAEARIRRCGEAAVQPLTSALGGASGPRAAQILAAVAPAAAVDALMAQLVALAPGAKPPPAAPRTKAGIAKYKQQRAAQVKNSKLRAAYRSALAVAASQPAATQVVAKQLAKALPKNARIDLLRALGGGVARHPGALASLNTLLRQGGDFRTRYLLIAPLSELAKKSPAARAELSRLLAKDPSGHIRAEAARSIDEPSQFQKELLTALGDREVRVREAAASVLSGPNAGFAEAPLTSRLTEDRWPLVRATAARSLGDLPASPRVDAALASALEDESPHVRRPVVLALGARGALRYSKAVAERLEDREEKAEVRAAAALALGRMCAVDQVDLLESYATKLANPFSDPELRPVAAA
ncbi:MAG: HEAT repeat domain-containing protein, partial [Myxococcales bacterium]|nr:HEAT repeat domain-containing protein [Myxococcales bacterium]